MTHRVFKISFASVYPHYVTKAEKKGRTKAEVDEIIRWLTGYSHEKLQEQIACKATFEAFFGLARPAPPRRTCAAVTEEPRRSSVRPARRN